MKALPILTVLFSFLTLSAHAEDSASSCEVIKQQNTSCAIVQKGGTYFLLEWAGKGFFHDGHKVCGDITVDEKNANMPLTLKDADRNKEMLVRLKKKSSDVKTLQEDYEMCVEK